ncbi:hypothetical protein HXX76_010413 [Chlamydomonas incerta]|uniref:Uncharacterized protein n=1 Tax=Chlamydomonas incerta TaxID=51695 RepID=A0A835VWB9_CHLIN|nr:hypothetical protein HXX76_010413 [Chlamydomonas incerta]|eukprot:KAG2428263.1 hypothetical protein HXX76_010413 [Chlamydomonas incerta]
MCNAKGSRVCGIICISCVLISFVALGAVLLFGGVAVLVQTDELSRVNNYNAVQNAVNSWNTPSSPYSLYQLQQLNATAKLVPGPAMSVAASSCPPLTLTLVPEQCTTDTYTDAANDFQPVPQLKLCGRLDYLAFAQCDYQVSFWATQPGGSGRTYNLTAPLDVSNSGPSWVVIDLQDMGGDDPCAKAGTRRCFGDPYNRCKSLCENTYGGSFSCDTFRNPPYTCEANSWTSSVAVKVVAMPNNNTYGIDTVYPLLGNGGAGANILRQGFQITMPTQINGAPMWLYDAGVYFAAPTAVTVMVRSSGDPYLTYMAVTSGTGWLGLNKSTVTWVGSILVGLGSSVFLGGLIFACCLAWGCGLARDRPDSPPDSCLKRQAWGMGMTCCPPVNRGKVSPDAAAAPGEAPAQQQQMVAYPAPGGGYVWVPAAAAAAGAAAGAAGMAAAAAYPPGAYPPGAYPPGAYPPGAYPPGAYPPGAYPPGAYPPGAYPPGAYPPGGAPPPGGAAPAPAAAGDVPVAPAVQHAPPPPPPPAADAAAPPPPAAAPAVQAAPPPQPPPPMSPAAAAPTPSSPAGALPPLSATYGSAAGAAGLPPLASRPVLPPL